MANKHNFLIHKMDNQAFSKTEEAIVSAVYGCKTVLSARVVVRRAKISRATFYRHHQNVHNVIPDLEEYLKQRFRRLIRGLLHNPYLPLRVVYLQTLVFISKNYRWFKVIVNRNGSRILEQMILMLTPKIAEDYNLPKNSDQMLHVYAKEVAGVLEFWIKNGAKIPEKEILRDIMYLTTNMRRRLSGLLK